MEGDLEDIFKNMRLDVHETARSVLFCFACNALLPIDDDATVIPEVLRGRPPTCPKCDVAVDVWNNVALALTRGGGAMATPTGAQHTAILYTLPVGRELSFDLREKGVPANAQLLRVVHRASGDAVAIVDLDATDSGRAPTFAIRVLGVPVVGAEEVVDVQGQTTVTWAEHDADDEGRRSLNRALLTLADDRLEETIVPANVAVEVTLNRVLAQHLADVGIGKERAKAFMSDAATYSHQLNVLLPVLLHGTGRARRPPMRTLDGSWWRGSVRAVRTELRCRSARSRARSVRRSSR